MHYKIYLLLIFIVSLFRTPAAIAQDSKTIDSLNALIHSISSDQPEKKAELYLDLTQLYMNQTDYVHASSCAQNSMTIAEKMGNDTLVAKCLKYLGTIQMNQHNFSKAVDYHIRALDIYKKKQDKAHQAAVIKALGDDYLQHHDSSTAEKYYEQALPLFVAINDKHAEASVYLNQATVATSNYSKRIALTLAAKKIYDSFPENNYLPTINIGNLGIIYSELVRYKIYKTIQHDPNIPNTEKGNLEKAEYYLNLAIQMAKQKKDFDNSSFFTGALAELQEYQGDYKNAYYNIRKYYDTQDSIYSQENKNKIAGLETQREVNIKNTEILNKELQLSAEQKQRNFLIGGLLLLAVIGGLLYWQSRMRKKTNRTLLRLNKELSEANRLKARFFGILSHDLRSPVASLINFLRLQKREPALLSEQQVEAQEQKIALAADTLLETMEAMLLWSKGQMEQFKPHISSVVISNLFIYLQKYFSGTEHIQFSFSAAGHLRVQTDENYLQSIMLNLTANAVKALTQTVDPKISWKAWQEHNTIYLSIADNGPGASDGQLKALYDEAASSGAKHGLGLHIIRDLAKAIHCTIHLKSHSSTGTEFVLSIPEMVSSTDESTIGLPIRH
jgi:signal transduction histidine kinase